MLPPSVLLPGVAGLVALIAGLVGYRGEFARARGLDKLTAFGPVFIAVGVAVFGMVHFTTSRAVMQVVPKWMPERLFWTYFVGGAQLCAALSIVAKKYVRLSGFLLGVMFFLFVLMIHVPNVASLPGNRIMWALVFRDLSFGAGAWGMAGKGSRGVRAAVVRFGLGPAALFFAVEHVLHPRFLPGIPLGQVTAAWLPFVPVWGYVTGALLAIAGGTALAGKGARAAMTAAGLMVTLVAVCLDMPMLVRASRPEVALALNVVADTLLYAGALLCGAKVMPR